MRNKAEKKSYYFSIYNNGACIRSRMERKYYQEARNRRKERDVGEIHRWIGTRPGPRAKKRKRRMIKFTSHLFCSFFFLSNRIIKVILQSAFRAATAP